jgi:transcriptional regulator
MYLPKNFEETRVEVLHELIRAHPLGALVTLGADGLEANHIPFAIFQGPQTYVSPSWYPSKQEGGKVVPTWNYAVVHAYGTPRAVDDAAWLRAFVEKLTHRHEAGRATPWKVTDAPADYVDKMVTAIVGIELPVARLLGKWKVSQNRPPRDREGVVAGLQDQGGDVSRAMAELVRRA